MTDRGPKVRRSCICGHKAFADATDVKPAVQVGLQPPAEVFGGERQFLGRTKLLPAGSLQRYREIVDLLSCYVILWQRCATKCSSVVRIKQIEIIISPFCKENARWLSTRQECTMWCFTKSPRSGTKRDKKIQSILFRFHNLRLARKEIQRCRGRNEVGQQKNNKRMWGETTFPGMQSYLMIQK